MHCEFHNERCLTSNIIAAYCCRMAFEVAEYCGPSGWSTVVGWCLCWGFQKQSNPGVT